MSDIKLSPQPLRHILTWNENIGCGLLAEGLEKLPFKNSDGSESYRITRLVGPNTLVRDFIAAFENHGSTNTVRLTATGLDGVTVLNQARIVLDQLGSDDYPYVETADMGVVGDVRLRVYAD